MKIFLAVLFSINSLIAGSSLERIIPGEVKDNAFADAIYRLAKSENIQTILEIGSSSGEGSTEAFVRGISENPCNPILFCIELSKSRYTALKKQYENNALVKCYNVSSIPLESFPTENDVVSFYTTTKIALQKGDLPLICGWLQEDIAYVEGCDVPTNGIELIKKENGINYFDLVLIDGSEFTGSAEFKLIYGANFILLDDINTFKNYNNYQVLLKDPAYMLMEQNFVLRNGYAIFKKIK